MTENFKSARSAKIGKVFKVARRELARKKEKEEQKRNVEKIQIPIEKEKQKW